MSWDLSKRPMVRIVVRRLVVSIPLLFIASALSFVLIALTPGDPARRLLGIETPPEVYRRLRAAMGLNDSLPERYWLWLSHAIHGDFGASLITSQRVSDAIDTRLPVTLSLMIGGLLVALVVGVGMGILSAVRAGGVVDRAVNAFALVGFALPGFWVGAALIAVFAVHWHLLPATGYVPLKESPTQWARSLVLPVIALSLPSLAAVAKQTREAMLDALSSEYVRMARASGVSERSIIFRHAFKNVGMRVVTLMGLLAIGLLGGTVFIETVFALPGIGSLAVNASVGHDLPVVEGVVVYFTVMVVIINLIVDLAYSALDPRVRTA
jgi:peptide/nickel transport system permease protein